MGEFRSGVLLCKLIQYHQPMIKFPGLNEKPVAKNACISNIEKGLTEMYKKKTRRQYIPTAEEIYQMKPIDKIWLFLKEIYDVFGMHDVEIWLKYVIKQWATPILEMYGLEFSKSSIESPYIGLCEDMKDGQILFALIHYFSKKNEKAKFTELHTSPETRNELLENLKIVFELAKEMELPVWWTPEEFLANPSLNLDFVKQQLYYIYRRLKDANELSVITDKSSCKDESSYSIQESPNQIPQGLFSQLIAKPSSALQLKSRVEIEKKPEQYLIERERMMHEEMYRRENKDTITTLSEKVKLLLSQKNNIEEHSPEKDEAIEMKCPFSEQSEGYQSNTQQDSHCEELMKDNVHSKREEVPIELKKSDSEYSSIEEDLKEILKPELYPFISECKSKEDPVIDSDFLLAYLMTPQVLYLSINKAPFNPYMFKLVPSPLMHLYFQQHYYLVWTGLDTAGVVSSLDITHIKCVKRQDNQKSFVLLLNTERRVACSESCFVISCETADDCYKYVTGLNYFVKEVKGEFENMPLATKKRIRKDLVLNTIPADIE